MPLRLKFAFFLLVLPIAALGHDIFYWQANQMSFEHFKLSSLTFILVEYMPELYDKALTSVGEDTWRTFVLPVLDMKTAFFLALPSLFLMIWVMISFIIQHLPGRTRKKRTTDTPARSRYEARNFKDSRTSAFFSRKGNDDQTRF